jgi:hypothetical protein
LQDKHSRTEQTCYFSSSTFLCALVCGMISAVALSYSTQYDVCDMISLVGISFSTQCDVCGLISVVAHSMISVVAMSCSTRYDVYGND